jgi:hypothetical protein
MFGLFGRPAHVTGSPAPTVGATHQMLPIGQMLLIGQMLSIGQMLLIGKMLPIGQMLLIGRMLLILTAPAVGAAPHDIYFLLLVTTNGVQKCQHKAPVSKTGTNTACLL